MAGIDKEIEGEARAQTGIKGRLSAAGARAGRDQNRAPGRGRRCRDVQGDDKFNAISDRFAEPMSDDEMTKALEEQAKLQDRIDAVDGWELERKLEIAADSLRLPPWDAVIGKLSRRRAAPGRSLPAAALEARHAAAR